MYRLTAVAASFHRQIKHDIMIGANRGTNSTEDATSWAPTHSKAKLESNQANAKASTGPVNTASTRYNAVKHGLLSQGVTELDKLDYHSFLSSVQNSLKPVGPIETALSERICLCLVRLKRAHGLEARFIMG